MITLTKTQSLYINNDLKAKGLSDGFRYELLDHICCMVESDLNSGTTFSKAYAKSLELFGEQGFDELKTIKGKVKHRSLFPQKIITTGIAACILLMVVGVDAQDKPDIHPLNTDCKVTSHFGNRYNPITKKKHFHNGIDFKVPLGTPIKSTADGTIKHVHESFGGYGRRIIISHSDGYETSYAHLSQIDVEKGQNIKKGDVIGLSGNSGKSTAPHLHYEVIQNGKRMDPSFYFASK